MKNEFQDLESLIPSVQNAFTKNPHRSLSAQFRSNRKSPRYSLIGCYPILATIVYAAISTGANFTRSKIFYALNQSEELKTYTKGDKKDFANHLLSPLPVALKQSRYTPNFNEKQDNGELVVTSLK